MPHVILEQSANLPQPADHTALFAELHAALQRIGGIRLGNCKSRLRVAERYYIGDGREGLAFAHLDVTFLAGRSEAVKHDIGTACLAILCRHYGVDCAADRADEAADEHLQITVRIGDIDPALYAKHPPGTLGGGR